jgi:hypothetical protein
LKPPPDKTSQLTGDFSQPAPHKQSGSLSQSGSTSNPRGRAQAKTLSNPSDTYHQLQVALPQSSEKLVPALAGVFFGMNLVSVSVAFCTLGLGAPLLVGFYAAQITIVCVGMAMAPGKFLSRLFVWGGITVLWLIAIALLPATFMLANIRESKQLVTGLGAIFFTLPMVLLGVQAPLWMMRFFASWRIVEKCDVAEKPFGIVDFLSAAILVGFAIASFQLAGSVVSLTFEELWITGAKILAICFGFSLLVIVPMLAWTLDHRLQQPNWMNATLLSGFVCGLLSVVGYLLIVATPQNDLLVDVGIAIVIGLLFWGGFITTMALVVSYVRRFQLSLNTSGSRQAELTYIEKQPEKFVFDDDDKLSLGPASEIDSAVCDTASEAQKKAKPNTTSPHPKESSKPTDDPLQFLD